MTMLALMTIFSAVITTPALRRWSGHPAPLLVK